MLSYAYLSLQSDSSSTKFSLNVADSDWGPNETLLSALTGTLVKYSHNGRIEPYLAQDFNVSDDSLKWRFNLRPNLYTQNGILIDAAFFKRCLESQLKLYGKVGNPLDFELLQGWEEFNKSKALGISGIVANGHSLSFIMRNKPMDFLELLRMPYFGVWNSIVESDTKINTFQSTGAYQIVPELSNEHKIVLKKRKNWFSISEKSVDIIEFKYLSDKEINTGEYNILQATSANPPKPIESFHLVSGTPSRMNAITLSPHKEGLFKNETNRRVFANKLKMLQEQARFIKSKYFYPSAQSKVITNVVETFVGDLTGKEVNFAFLSASLKPNLGEETIGFIKKIFEETGAIVKFHFGEPMKNNWMQRLLGNIEFDARINNVDIGGHIQNAAIKMMFCSKLGVNFPDPSGRICNLVKKQDQRGGPITQEYISEFNQILAEDAVVIPLMHFGITWHLSEKIDPATFPPTVVSPLFESIHFK